MAGGNIEPFREIGRRLAEIRLAKGLTQRDLAARLERPRSFVSKLEVAERRLDIIDLQALAGALELPATELLVRLLRD